MTTQRLWQHYRQSLVVCEEIGLWLDVSRLRFQRNFFERMSADIERAFEAMAALEKGAIANPDENRQVGHYWLRSPKLAPATEQRKAIEETLERIQEFAKGVHEGEIAPPGGGRFTDLLVIGIGGSALGPQLAADALGHPESDRLRPHFFDNTDPDGLERALAELGDALPKTLVIVISKSGSTPETRNGLAVARAAWERAGLELSASAVAITGEGSKLDRLAEEEGWLEHFPMWDWVGGRTSQTSAVGLVPAALQGLDVEALLAGAAAADEITRRREVKRNPAMLLALAWFAMTRGKGEKDMVILPYKDRLLLFSRYLQQLVMESLGKGRDLDGWPVEQGIAVYGNKGSTDQHAYVQQLREGVKNFFVTFIEVLEDGGDTLGGDGPLEVEPGVTCGDYLRGFLLGTREALHEAGRDSITITVERLDARTLGVLIALYERAVGFYASLVNINAYHQPGVEAGKKAAASILELQKRVVEHMGEAKGPQSAEEIATALGVAERTEIVWRLLEAQVRNGRGVRRYPGSTIFEARYALEKAED